jgi:hypothetical protein
MSEELVIRIAGPKDLDEVMALAMSACDENGFVNPDPTKLLGEIWPALHRDHGLVGVIGRKDGIIEGGILLRVGTMWYSTQEVLEEKAIFIHPEYRTAKGGRARKLCEFGKKSAEALGIPLIIGVLSNQRTEAKMRMYQRTFGTPSGAFFLYNATTGMSRTEH